MKDGSHSPLPESMAEEVVRLSNRHDRKWFTIAYRILAPWATDVEAEEVVEASLEQIVTQWRRFDRERGSLESYCVVVIASRALDRRRRLKGRALALQKAPSPAPPAVPTDAEVADRVRRLYREITKLTPVQREAVEAYLDEERERHRMKDSMRAALGRAKRRLRSLMMPAAEKR